MKKQEQTYLMEAQDGTLALGGLLAAPALSRPEAGPRVRVPESRVAAWSRAQAEGSTSLNNREQQIKELVLRRLYNRSR